MTNIIDGKNTEFYFNKPADERICNLQKKEEEEEREFEEALLKSEEKEDADAAALLKEEQVCEYLSDLINQSFFQFTIYSFRFSVPFFFLSHFENLKNGID